MAILSAHAPVTKRKKSSCGRTERSIPDTSMPRPLPGFTCARVRVAARTASSTTDKVLRLIFISVRSLLSFQEISNHFNITIGFFEHRHMGTVLEKDQG